MSERSRYSAKFGLDALSLLPFNDSFQFVNAVEDFGPSINGVRTLVSGKTYFVIGDIDLNGDRLETGGVVTLLGTSSETASITSTGLGAGVPLLTSRYTLPVRFLTFKDVHTGIYIDDNSGANAPLAIDWFGVNFLNVTVVGEIGDVDNFIYDTGAFLGSQGLTFTGTAGTVGISNSLFRGDGSADNLIEVTATAVITRRFRIIYSSIVAFGSTVGISFSASTTVPVESYILDTVNFSGGSTYTSGVAFSDNKAKWTSCVGVRNSASLSNYYMQDNAVASTIASIGVAVKAAGVTSSNTVTQKFVNTSNRATYVGAISRDMKATAVISATSGNGHQVGIYIAKNGTVITSSEMYITTNASGRAESGVAQVIVEMVTDDYLEVFIENATSITDITVSDLTFIVEGL
tara:strand:- start:95 stop:1309 length:1215 start_codon:yes stop_codon:yes gene_type:complete